MFPLPDLENVRLGIVECVLVIFILLKCTHDYIKNQEDQMFCSVYDIRCRFIMQLGCQ